MKVRKLPIMHQLLRRRKRARKGPVYHFKLKFSIPEPTWEDEVDEIIEAVFISFVISWVIILVFWAAILEYLSASLI